MKSGMLAAETACEALKRKNMTRAHSRYEQRFRESWAYKRSQRAQLPSGLRARHVPACSTRARRPSGGRGSASATTRVEAATRSMVKYRLPPKETPRAKIDNVLTFDKLTDVYQSAARCTTRISLPSHVADTNDLRATVHGGVREPVRGTFVRRPSTSRYLSTNGGGSRGPAADQLHVTACTARPATSPTRIRSSPGCRRKAARAPSTLVCSMKLICQRRASATM